MKPCCYLTLLFFLISTPVLAGDRAFTLTSFDGFKLPAKVAGPQNAKAKKVIILIHGSGPNSMDVPMPGTKGSLFKPLSDSLASKGFTVIRYDKRSYRWNQIITADRNQAKSKGFATFMQNFYDYLIKDVKAAVAHAKKAYPKASIYLLGQSQGTFVALQAAYKNPDIKGVALWGYYGINLGALTYVQSVYRNLHFYKILDADKDGALSAEELKKGPPGISALVAGIPTLDRDKDGKLSVLEIQAVQFANLTASGMAHNFIRQEAKFPPAIAILKTAPFKVAFFQGVNDNQTPVFHTHAAQILLEQAWKRPKSQFMFRYFKGLGHGLDPRPGYYDMNPKVPAPHALKTLSSDLAKFF